MALKGYIDHAAHRARAKQELLDRHGPDFEPLGGWDGFYGDDRPICDARCQMCHRLVPEVRPFGPNHESICEDCAAKDPNTHALRLKGLGLG